MRRIITVIILGLFLYGSSIAQSYQLVWADEINGTSIDLSKWNFETGNNNGWGNNEWEYYTNRTSNAYLENGNLVIKAIKESYGGKDYTSARMKTQDKYSVKYGKIEARIKLPYGKGIWPAFWTLGNSIAFSGVGWPKCGEIDIMEMIGGNSYGDKTIYGTAHWDDNGHKQAGSSYRLPAGNYSDAFHVFDIVWDAQKIIWHMDGIQFYRIDLTPALSELQDPQFILLNLAVGGNWPGYPDNTTVFPQTMSVDYVRVYQLSTGVEEKESVPENNSLGQNYPNPFNPETSIKYSLSKPEYVQLKVFDLMGKVVAVLVDGHKEAGAHMVNFNSVDSALSNGIYFYRLMAGGNALTRKMLLLK
jgi:beta-glucanase (GH16 family)